MAGILIVAALYLGKDILMPAALAILLAFLLFPLVKRLRRWKLPHVPAVLVTLAVAGLVTSVVGYVVADQLVDLVQKLPDYKDNLVVKAREVRGSSSGPFARLLTTLEELKLEFSGKGEPPPSVPSAVAEVAGTAPQTQPVKVEVADDSTSFSGIVAVVAGGLAGPLSQLAIVVLLLIFLLLHGEDILDRLVTFAGLRRISLTNAAMDEVTTGIGRYLRMQAVINGSYGAMVAMGLMVFGVPNALLWGILAAVLRFVPFVGPWLAAIMPMLLSFAVFPGWTRPLGVVAMFVCIELFSNMVMEPWLYGNGTGVSSFGVVVAAVFWGWVWGAVGLILSVPITVCLVVMGKHLPALSVLHHLFGGDVDVPVVGKLYQKLLAGDEFAVEALVNERLREQSFTEACDELLLPALAELKRDEPTGLIDSGQIRRALRLIDMIGPDAPKKASSAPRLLSIAGKNEIDAAAARLLARCAAENGVAAEAISSHALASEAAARAREHMGALVAVVQVPPVSSLHSRHLLNTLLRWLDGDGSRLVDVSINLATAKVAGEPQKAGKDEAANAELPDVRRERAFAPLIARLRERASMDAAKAGKPVPVPA